MLVTNADTASVSDEALIPVRRSKCGRALHHLVVAHRADQHRLVGPPVATLSSRTLDRQSVGVDIYGLEPTPHRPNFGLRQSRQSLGPMPV